MSGRTLQVRAVRPADAGALNELVESTLGQCLGAVLPQEELDACARDYGHRRAGQTCFVADADGQLAGYAVISRDASPCGPVERLYVRRQSVGNGEEREVVEALVSALCVEQEVSLPIAQDGRDTTLELYDRWGFVDMNAMRRCLSVPSGHGRLTDLLQADEL